MKFSKQVGNVQLMQKINRLKVLNYVRQNQPVSRPLVARETGLSLSSITNIITYLMDMDMISETGMEDVERVGRKAALLTFNSGAYRLICVTIEKEKMLLTLTDLAGRQFNKKTIQINHSDAKSVIEDLKREIGKMLNRFDKDRILGIGISVSGLILKNKQSIFSASLKWKTVDMKEELELFLKKPVFIENVSLIKAVWQLSSKDFAGQENVIFLDTQTGIGAVQLYKGGINRGIIGEIGHTTVDKDGEECPCGNRGCLEAVCSVEKIVRDCEKLLEEGKSPLLKELVAEDRLRYDIVRTAVEKGDAEVLKILSQCGEYLGIGIANLINIFNPSMMIIEDSELLKIDFLYEKAIEWARKRAYKDLTDAVLFEKVKIDTEQFMKGFAVHVCDQLFDISFSQNIIE